MPAFCGSREVDRSANVGSGLGRQQRLNAAKGASHHGDTLRVDEWQRVQVYERGQLILQVNLHHLHQFGTARSRSAPVTLLLQNVHDVGRGIG